jgi:iron(III) transport system substrate-binding protein
MNENVEPSDLIQSMGTFKQDLSTPVEDYAKFQSIALELMLRSGWK